MDWLIHFLMTPQNSTAFVAFIIGLMLFKELRYVVWKAILFSGASVLLIYVVKYVSVQ